MPGSPLSEPRDLVWVVPDVETLAHGRNCRPSTPLTLQRKMQRLPAGAALIVLLLAVVNCGQQPTPVADALFYTKGGSVYESTPAGAAPQLILATGWQDLEAIKVSVDGKELALER